MSEINSIPSFDKFVSDWSQLTVKKLGQAIVKKKIGGSALKASLQYRIIGGPDGSSKIVFTYQNIGKFIDMGVGRGQKFGDVKGNKAAYKAAGIKGGRKAKTWYSTTMTSETRRLAELAAELYGRSIIAVVNDSIPNEIVLTL